MELWKKFREMSLKDFEKLYSIIGIKFDVYSGESMHNSEMAEIIKELTLITGQRGQVIRSKQAISGFKLRLGQVAGIRATIRGSHAVDFLGRLIDIVLPRIKDFRGLSPHSIDRGGVLNIGLKDKSIFPEIIPEESRVSFGLEVSIIPKTRDRAKALSFYKACRLPLKHG